MRIISGSHKGRKINAPRKLIAKPTTGKAKEAIFNILNNHYLWGNISVLELFAGTGNISCEFASRGVKKITLIENNPICIKHIKKIMENLKFQFNPIKINVFKFLSKRIEYPFDIIFADPPYDLDLKKYEAIINKIFKFKMLKNDGIIILEHSNKIELDSIKTFYMKRKYGGCFFSFFKNIIT